MEGKGIYKIKTIDNWINSWNKRHHVQLTDEHGGIRHQKEHIYDLSWCNFIHQHTKESVIDWKQVLERHDGGTTRVNLDAWRFPVRKGNWQSICAIINDMQCIKYRLQSCRSLVSNVRVTSFESTVTSEVKSFFIVSPSTLHPSTYLIPSKLLPRWRGVRESIQQRW